jgi:sterol desaturase/sphingolipid hydroxylase (fatty acid hydroxylase superfamily)
MRASPILWAIPFFLATMLAEAAWLRRGGPGRRGRPYEMRDAAASLSMGLGYLAIQAFWKTVDYAAYSAFFRVRLFEIGTGPWAWLAVVVGWDLCYYGYHRASHVVRLFWATHVNHHSSERYNLSTALRQNWTPFLGGLFYIPLAIVGFRPEMILIAGAWNLLYQYWIHTEIVDRMPAWFEAIFNTPSHHRVHHGTNSRYLDRNYAGIFIVWDRLFGTFEPEAEPVVYGLTSNIRTFHPVKIAFHEWSAMLRDVLRARTWSDRAHHVLGHPAWKPATALTTPSAPVAPAIS